MGEEEKFDELLNSKLSERDFPLNELSWDDAERLIDRQEKREKRTRFAFIFLAGLVAGALIMLPFIMGTHTAIPATVAVHSASGQSAIEQKPPQVVSKQSATNMDNNTIQAKPKTTASVSEENNQAGVQSAFVKKNGIRVGIQNTPAGISVAQGYSQHSVSSPGVSKHSVQSPAKLGNPTSSAAVEASAKDNTKTENVPGTANDAPSRGDNQTITKNNPPVSNMGDSNMENKTVNNTPAVVKPSSSNPVASTKNAVSNATMVNNNNPFAAKKNNNGIRYPDTSQHTTDDLLNSVIFRNIFSVYAGGTYSSGWWVGGTAKEIRQGNGITPWAGFNFTHYFTGHVSASLGIGYAELTGLSNEYTSGVVQYGFGTNENVTAVTPQIVYYMAFPFKLQYDIDSKDLMGIGCNYLLMMTTYSTLATYQQTDFATNSYTSEKQNGYTQGFSNSDWQLTLSYTRMFMGRLGISAEYFHDFNYIENNTIPNLSQSAKNSGFRLVVSYQILK